MPPTGPRGSISHSVPATPVSASKPFDPPKGPAADNINKNNINNKLATTITAGTTGATATGTTTATTTTTNGGSGFSLAQQLLASMPPLLLPGGKADPAQLAADTLGVLPEHQAHTQRLKEEEERIREDKYAKEERLRRGLADWDRMRREARVMELRDRLAEETLKKISGEGTSGAAF